MTPPANGPSPHHLSRALLLTLAVCAGAAVANLYYAQPLLATIGQDLREPSHVGWVAVATQVGYTLGILFILPLGDLVDRRRMTVVLAGLLALSQLACAFAPSLTALALGCVAVGVAAVITQVMVPMAADLAEPAERSHAVGVVFSGILGGILLARTISGALGQVLGWRAMLAIAAGAAIALAVALGLMLPRLQPKVTHGYLALLGSMRDLLRRHRPLRVACAIQACVFALFSAFWSVLALLLARPPFEFGPAVAGSFGLVGLVGVVAANLSGRWIDRVGSRHALRVGLGCCVAAFVVLRAWVAVPGLVVGVLLLDFGMSVANVANQSLIMGLEAEARSRINTLYVGALFLGGATGSAAASAAWVHGGWAWVADFGIAVALVALGLQLLTRHGGVAPAAHAVA